RPRTFTPDRCAPSSRTRHTAARALCASGLGPLRDRGVGVSFAVISSNGTHRVSVGFPKPTEAPHCASVRPGRALKNGLRPKRTGVAGRLLTGGLLVRVQPEEPPPRDLDAIQVEPRSCEF